MGGHASNCATDRSHHFGCINGRCGGRSGEERLAAVQAPEGSDWTVTRIIYYRALLPLGFSAWATSMMAPGGIAITGLPPRGKHPDVLSATNPLVMWAYSDLSDKRWTFTKKYL